MILCGPPTVWGFIAAVFVCGMKVGEVALDLRFKRLSKMK